MKNKWLAFLLLSGILFATAFRPTANGDEVNGVWLTADKKGKIEIYRSGTKYFGKLIWGTDLLEADGKTSKKDTKNEDPALRTRTLKNMVMLKDFVFDDGKFVDGTIYDPNNGKTYSCEMKLNKNKLEIRGYIGIPMFGRTEVWTRAIQ